MPVDEQREEHPEYYLEVEAQQTYSAAVAEGNQRQCQEA